MSAVDSPSATRPQPIQPEVGASLVTGTATQVTIHTAEHSFTIDEPVSLGGTNQGANPVEHLLAALGSCQVITYQIWAEKLGIRLDSIAVSLNGDVDLRGLFGLHPDIRPGFSTIDVQVTLDGPESTERYRELTRLVEQHCPVLDGIENRVPVQVSCTRGETGHSITG